MGKDRQVDQVEIDTDTDRYPTLTEAVNRLRRELKEGDRRVSRLDLRFDANGHGYYRLWAPRSDDHDVGAIPNP